ncbi:hypothetical protein D8Y22_11200 [Salinadaptatus halalkaliphilus]|uniref:Uncharacterized protein n=1 Tax=Salinadaptatus halalkaliphilus TaxID=2419781 RepID=A0A4S3TKV8_9EURY|nr:hypothetical protein [Salinadaptatus halalkaliphilus]THE64751.1 hypothetical protein D8Y22_11200 [Salinadaptatus halalkaliphilus]
MPSELTDTTLASLPDDCIAEFETLHERLDTLEATLEAKDDRITQLETELEEARSENERLERRVTELEERTSVTARLEAHEKKLNANKARVLELQAREIEKGAHLLETNVDDCDLDVSDDRLERIRKDDGRAYYRLPEHSDPLDRGGEISLAYGDLLPIQQLAKMDDDLLHSTANTLPTQLAAKLWRARVDPSVGDNPWASGCKGIDEYVKASDLKHWIRRQEQGVSESYAQKLVSRVIDAILDLSKHRLAVRKRTERKNGLEYTERRLLLPEDVDIPGATATHPDIESPKTSDVHG